MSKLFSELERKIAANAQKYYEDGSSGVTDAEFDDMIDELRAVNPDSELLHTTGWGYDVSLDSTPGEKCLHKYGPIGSLDKCRTWKELKASLKTDEVYLSLKLDGISVVLYYEHGKFVKALTRGSGDGGTVGIDITDRVNVIFPDANIADTTFTGAVRGEILMSFKNFEKFQSMRSDAKNARNSTAGLINSKELSPDLKYLDILVYTVVGDEAHTIDTPTMSCMVAWLNHNFKKVAPYTHHPLTTEAEFISTLTQLKADWYGQYPADGIVITKHSVAKDTNTHYITYDSQAFKFKAETVQTEVVQVEWNLSKSRYLIPKIRVNTVQLSGTNVSFCTGYNAKYIKDNGIATGTIVSISKHGEIIPNIDKVITSKSAELPTHCPECHELLEWYGVHLVCPNDGCKNATRQDLSVWIQTLAPIDGLKDNIRFKFLEQIFGTDVSIEVVMLSPCSNYAYENCNGHKKMIYDMFRKLYGDDNSTIALKDAIIALNIPRFGSITAEKLAQYPKYVQVLMESSEIPSEFWVNISDSIGAANSQSLKCNWWKFNRLNYIKNRINWESSKHISSGKCKVAITGKLSVKRAEFEKELQAAGYQVAEISKDTRFLITDTPNSSSSKNMKANAWGIQKLTESEFRKAYL